MFTFPAYASTSFCLNTPAQQCQTVNSLELPPRSSLRVWSQIKMHKQVISRYYEKTAWVKSTWI